MSHLASSIIIFSIIRSSIEHANHKIYPGKIKDTIDSDTQDYCFLMTCLFFLDFISVWFDQYSKYFAGNRFEKVSNNKELAL
jgi:hypothetical protein